MAWNNSSLRTATYWTKQKCIREEQGSEKLWNQSGRAEDNKWMKWTFGTFSLLEKHNDLEAAAKRLGSWAKLSRLVNLKGQAWSLRPFGKNP